MKREAELRRLGHGCHRVCARPCSGAVNAPPLFSDCADRAIAAGCDFVGMEGEHISFARGDMVFMPGACEDEPETVCFAADSRLAIGGI